MDDDPLREEGWKEVKMSAISQVEVRPPAAKQASSTPQSGSDSRQPRPRRREKIRSTPDGPQLLCGYGCR